MQSFETKHLTTDIALNGGVPYLLLAPTEILSHQCIKDGQNIYTITRGTVFVDRLRWHNTAFSGGKESRISDVIRVWLTVEFENHDQARNFIAGQIELKQTKLSEDVPMPTSINPKTYECYAHKSSSAIVIYNIPFAKYHGNNSIESSVFEEIKTLSGGVFTGFAEEM